MTTARSFSSVILFGLLFNLFLYSTAHAQPEDEKLGEKVKAEITRLGRGQRSRVKIILKDRTKISGYLSDIAEEHFTVVDKRSYYPRKISYSNVSQVKTPKDLSKKAKIALGFVILTGIWGWAFSKW